MFVISKDLGDQNLVFLILKPRYFFCHVLYLLCKKVNVWFCFVLFFFLARCIILGFLHLCWVTSFCVGE